MGPFPWLRPKNAPPDNPSAPLGSPAEWLVEWFSGGPTYSGITVSEETATRCGAVYDPAELRRIFTYPLPHVQVRLRNLLTELK